MLTSQRYMGPNYRIDDLRLPGNVLVPAFLNMRQEQNRPRMARSATITGNHLRGGQFTRATGVRYSKSVNSISGSVHFAHYVISRARSSSPGLVPRQPSRMPALARQAEATARAEQAQSRRIRADHQPVLDQLTPPWKKLATRSASASSAQKPTLTPPGTTRPAEGPASRHHPAAREPRQANTERARQYKRKALPVRLVGHRDGVAVPRRRRHLGDGRLQKPRQGAPPVSTKAARLAEHRPPTTAPIPVRHPAGTIQDEPCARLRENLRQ